MPKIVKKHKKYKNPPITEAVIEVRFADSLTEQQLEKLIAKQKSKFTIRKLEQVELKILHEEKSDAQTETKKTFLGYKLVDNSDSSNIVQVKRNAISVSRLPPYEDWTKLISSLKKHYEWYTSKQFKPLSRIGVRYINRIDIPAETGKIEVEDYFKIFPHVPKTKFPDLNHFLMQTITAIDDDKVLTINFHSTETPLLKHISMVFDLDVAQQANLPVSNSKLYNLLDVIRDKKDIFFEDLLTAKCKRLFN